MVSGSAAIRASSAALASAAAFSSAAIRASSTAFSSAAIRASSAALASAAAFPSASLASAAAFSSAAAASSSTAFASTAAFSSAALASAAASASAATSSTTGAPTPLTTSTAFVRPPSSTTRYVTCSPSSRDRNPSFKIADWWTKISFSPESLGAMNPNPFFSSNHFTVPATSMLIINAVLVPRGTKLSWGATLKDRTPCLATADTRKVTNANMAYLFPWIGPKMVGRSAKSAA
mmetsp:Transcript_16312/g.23899  ORF Transcript_16312/g.23899 Transcript_16312/m.23899 type:complete len:234 (-) Transcript_16312:20-721(-)